MTSHRQWHTSRCGDSILPPALPITGRSVIKEMESKNKKIYGYTSQQIVDRVGKKPEFKKYKLHQYLQKAFEDIEIPEDTAFILTDQKKHPYDSSEIAPAKEKINGEDKTIFAIFIHEFSIGALEKIYKQLEFFVPEATLSPAKVLITGFIRKVLWHELGHRKAWLEEGVEESEGVLRDTEDEAEAYAWEMVKQHYGEAMYKALRTFNFAVFCDYMREEEKEKAKKKVRKKKKEVIKNGKDMRQDIKNNE